ncbi:MAG: hypothetical protein KAS23_11850, partial [Anaerohalosphaera sp.]|nr:hypothetical protein [Anaerohalosphaera sp.]
DCERGAELFLREGNILEVGPEDARTISLHFSSAHYNLSAEGGGPKFARDFSKIKHFVAKYANHPLSPMAKTGLSTG